MKYNQLKKRLSKGQKLYQEFEADIEHIDPRIKLYVLKNLFEPEKHGTYEILAVIKFLEYFEKYDFSVSSYKRYIKFVEQLKIKSEFGMQAFKLEPFQCFLVANLWGWKDSDGTNLIKDALFFVPRKASKSSLIAQLAIYGLLFGPPDAQIYCSSNSFNQSKIIFDIITASVKSIDPSMRSFRRTRDKIYSVIQDRDSFIQCLSCSPDRLDGLNAYINIFDELSQAKDFKVKQALESSQGARKNYLNIAITTASTNINGPFTRYLANHKKVLEGEIENDNLFSVIFEAEDNDDISSPNVWNKVQPMMGIAVNEKYYHTQYNKAILCAEDMVEFKTKLLNIFTLPITTQWIRPNMISRNLTNINISDITTRPMCMVGVDLSISDDMSAVAYGLYDSINKSFVFKVDYYIPKLTIENHPNRELYSKWLEDGYLKICGDEVIDYEQIARDIINNSKYLNILSIGYDSYKAKDLVNYLKASGVKCLQAVKQVYSTFTAPVESFELSLAQGKIKLDDNPITQWMFTNVVIDEDNMANKKPIKTSANKKIDGVITILEALYLFMNWKR